jgi:hypothetical protein
MKEAGAAKKGMAPNSVTFKTKNNNPDFKQHNGIPQADGELDVSDIGPSLSGVRTIKLQGLRQKPNQPVVFKRKDIDVPLPTFWSEEGGEPAEIWYGEGVGQFKAASATLIAGADGSVAGSVTDGTHSYMVTVGLNHFVRWSSNDGEY